MPKHGPSHEVALPSYRTDYSLRPSVAAQALQRAEDGVWTISVVGPAGHLHFLPDEALALSVALERAHADFVRLSHED